MLGTLGIAIMFASALLVAVADSIIKKASASATLSSVVFSPWMIAICLLYFVQIVLAVYIFVHKGELAVYGNIFNVFYCILMVLFGVFFFEEHLSAYQGLGIVLGLAGAILLNSGL